MLACPSPRTAYFIARFSVTPTAVTHRQEKLPKCREPTESIMSSDKFGLHSSQKEINKETQKVGMQSLCCYSLQTDFHLEGTQAKGKAVAVL